MKKALFLAIAFSLTASFAFSQLSFGPRVGLNISKYDYNWNTNWEEPEVKFRFGQSVGAVMNLNLGKIILFQPAVSLIVKGVANDVTSWESGDKIYQGYQRDRILYLEIPLNFAVGINVGPGNLQIFAGPYVAIGLNGTQVMDYEKNENGIRTTTSGTENIELTNSMTQSEFEKDKISNRRSAQRSLDYGFDVGLGYKVNHLLFNVGYAMGLANLQPDISGDEYKAEDYKYSNRTIFITVAWLFGGK